MWIFTKDGFYSAVKHRDIENYVMVRARFSEDLEKFLSVIPKEHRGAGIGNTPYADYPYRVSVPKSVWVNYVSGCAFNIDYDNFKSAVLGDSLYSERSMRYHEVWSAMRGVLLEPKLEAQLDLTFDEPLSKR